MYLRYYTKEQDPAHGPYWDAVTEKGGYDGSGKDPLEAITDLALAMEEALGEKKAERE